MPPETQSRIVVKLDDLLHARRMTLTELAERIDLTLANVSILKTGKAIRPTGRADLSEIRGAKSSITGHRRLLHHIRARRRAGNRVRDRSPQG